MSCEVIAQIAWGARGQKLSHLLDMV